MMISEEEGRFYSDLRAEIKRHPEWTASAIQAIQSGLTERINQEVDASKEWETVALNAMEARMFKNNKGWLAQKIEKLEGRAFFRWTHIIERLKK